MLLNQQPKKFIELIAKSKNRGWCMKHYCTTCGAGHFRESLKKIANLEEDLSSTPISKLLGHSDSVHLIRTIVPRWSAALQIVVSETSLSLNWDTILASWFPQASQNATFLDHIIFYILPRINCSSSTLQKWTDQSASMAIESKDASLLESLIRRLGSQSQSYAGLVDTGIRVSQTYKPLERALKSEAWFNN